MNDLRAAATNRPVTSEDVVDAAEQLLRAGGFESLSVRAVGERLGVSRQVVYTHFGGVDGLLDALHRRASRYLSESVGAVPAEPGTVEHFVGATRSYIDVAREHPHLYQLLFGQPVADYRPSSEASRAGRASFGHIVVSADAWLHGSAGSVPADEATWDRDATELARAVWTAGHGFVVLERAGYATVDETDRLAAATVRALLAGWSVPPGR